MPIPEQEIRRLFDKLAAQLRERGAATVVDQVIDEITQGKQIIYKTVKRPHSCRSAEALYGKRESGTVLAPKLNDEPGGA